MSRLQRAAFQHRSAFGSLSSLAPLACALIDCPFALNAKLELFIRPNAPDGSTSLLLLFARSVPILGHPAPICLQDAGDWAKRLGWRSSRLTPDLRQRLRSKAKDELPA